MKLDWKTFMKPRHILCAEHELRSFESRLGHSLPFDYREFLLEINGGCLHYEHDIPLPEWSCSTSVHSLLPLTENSPGLGINEAREIQVAEQRCLEALIEIGSDGGTGFFFLVLEGPRRGTVVYSFKEDVFASSGLEWNNDPSQFPNYMIQISTDFTALGVTILTHGT